MSAELFYSAYDVLDNDTIHEDDQIDSIQELVKKAFPDLGCAEVERVVLDILMAHHRRKDPAEAARSQQISVRANAQKPSTAVSLPKAGDSTQISSSFDNFESLRPFDQLKKVFGWENSDDDIERALAHNDYDIERTVDMLSGEPIELNLSKEKLSSRIMCRYYVSGHCARGEACMYSHDSSTRICRFWLHHRCIAGESCLYRHEIPDVTMARLQSSQTEATPPEIVLSNLPSLHSFPKLGAKAAKARKPAQAALQASSPKAVVKHRTLLPIQQVLGTRRGLVLLTYPRLVPWKEVEFGSNGAYCELRKLAAADADQRNKKLQQSTAAWSANDPYRAKQLSERGREHEKAMISRYREAAALLWDQRELPGSEIWIDLHGMDLGDAVCDLEDKLLHTAEAKHNPRAVFLITGRGHFAAKAYTDTLTQYVKMYLDSHGFKNKDFGVDPLYGRIIVVDPYSSLRSS